MKMYAVMMVRWSTTEPHRIFSEKEEALKWVEESYEMGFRDGAFAVYECTLSPWVPVMEGDGSE